MDQTTEKEWLGEGRRVIIEAAQALQEVLE
jgi:hypothetical protein